MENSKSLKTIQRLAKLAKVLSIIVFTFCVIGAVLCIIAGVALYFMQNVKFHNQLLPAFITAKTGMSFWYVIAVIALAALACIAEAIIAKLAHNYFSDEVDDGTPFTFEGAQHLRRVGVAIIIISIVFTAAAIILYVYAKSQKAFDNSVLLATVRRKFPEQLSDVRKALDSADHFNFGSFGNIGIGLAFLIQSAIFRHGAELRDEAIARLLGGSAADIEGEELPEEAEYEPEYEGDQYPDEEPEEAFEPEEPDMPEA